MNQNQRVHELSEVLVKERFVLQVQDALLTPGVHTINVVSFGHGRGAIISIIDSLPVVPTVGYISENVPVGAIDICSEMLHSVHGDEADVSIELLESYLIHELNTDILVIELYPELVIKPWFSLFYSLLQQLYFSSSVIVMNETGF